MEKNKTNHQERGAGSTSVMTRERNNIVRVRLSAKEKKIFSEFADKRGMDLSNLVRMLLHRELEQANKGQAA